MVKAAVLPIPGSPPQEYRQIDSHGQRQGLELNIGARLGGYFTQ